MAGVFTSWGFAMGKFVAALVSVGMVGVVVANRVEASQPSRCADSSRACVISVANTYIQALVSHKGATVPLASDARRTENGMVTGTSGPGIASDLSSNQGDKSIYDARDIRWFVDGDQAIAYYLLDTGAGAGTSSPHTTTEHLAERFKVDGGLIHQIEAIFWVSPGPSLDSDCWSAPC